MTTRKMLRFAGLLLAGAVLAGCADSLQPTSPATPGARLDVVQAPAPALLSTVPFGAGSLTLFPYTDSSFAGSPQDPVNLLFPGRTPREVRAALLMLDGDRSAVGIPHVFPFDCVWKDATGGTNQAAYTAEGGWVGSGIQLTCGDYGPVRFHVRLFATSNGTIGATHFDMLIPGTINHAVISWTLPRSLIAADLMRSGLLDGTIPLFPVPVGSHTPTFRAVEPSLLYWGLKSNPATAPLAAQLDVTEVAPGGDVLLNNDGAAYHFNFAAPSPAGERVVAHQAITIQFDQTIPRPVCSSGPFDYVYVSGPITLRQQVVYTPAGNLVSQFHAEGKLSATPVNPLTGAVVGETFQAVLLLSNKEVVTDEATLVSWVDVRMGMPASIFKGSVRMRVRVGPGEATIFSREVTCD